MRIEAEELGAEPAAQRRHAAAERERDGEQAPDIDAERTPPCAVIDRGADLRPHAGALEAEPEGEHDNDADDDQKDAVGAVVNNAEIELPLQRLRQGQRLVLRADQQRDRRDDDEHEPDAEQHLVELGRAIEPGIEQALEHDADRSDGDEAERERGREAQPPAPHAQHDDVAAEHREGAVREVDEAHQAHGDGQPDRHDEQHHPGGEPAEQHVGDFDDEIHKRARRIWARAKALRAKICARFISHSPRRLAQLMAEIVEHFAEPPKQSRRPVGGGLPISPSMCVGYDFGAQGPIFCSLQGSFTLSILPSCF